VQLSLHSDYALRVLVYLGTYPDRVVTTREISGAYGISRHHLVRVVQTLAEHQYVNVHAGRSGGVTLARAPQMIFVGDVIRSAEPNFHLTECFDAGSNTCPIARVCALKGMLNEGLSAFLAALNRYTIADVLKNSDREKLGQVFATFVSGASR
jgi:Rrf2 family transcriptional regulator, nitric oxide-sensitive transcriptional repressor